MLEAIEKKNRRKRWRLSREMFESRIPRATPRASASWISRRRIGSILDGDVDSTASSCARNLLPSLGRFLMLQHRNWWKEWLKCLLFIAFRQAFRRLTKAYSGGFVGVLQQLKHRISWAHLAFNGTPTHPSIYRASLSNANGVVCPCTQVLPLHRRLSLFFSASDPLKSGSVFCRPISQWCWILEILLSRKKSQEIRFDWLLVA